MLTIPAAVRIYLCTQPIDCRRSFDGLAGLVRDFMKCEPLSGHLFVFRNRSGHLLKILHWDRDGLAIWYKRLERGTFVLPKLASAATAAWELSAAELAMLLEGLDLNNLRRHPRYRLP